MYKLENSVNTTQRYRGKAVLCVYSRWWAGCGGEANQEAIKELEEQGQGWVVVVVVVVMVVVVVVVVEAQ